MKITKKIIIFRFCKDYIYYIFYLYKYQHEFKAPFFEKKKKSNSNS